MILNGVELALGAVTGLVVGLTGVGGGAIMTPALILLAGVHPGVAVGTDLWFAAITKIVATAIHGRRGQVDWPVARRMWLGSLPIAAFVTIAVATGLSIGKLPWLTQAIAVAVGLTGMGLLFRQPTKQTVTDAQETSCMPAISRRSRLTAVVGALVGVCVALTSIGAGALGTLALLSLYRGRLTTIRVIGTDIVHAIPLAVIAGTGYAMLGLVDVPLLTNLLTGSVPAVLAGSALAHRINTGTLRWCLGLMLVVVAAKIGFV